MTRKAISASHPELLVRFAKESSMSKSEMVPDVDHMDISIPTEPKNGVVVFILRASMGSWKLDLLEGHEFP